MKPRRIPVITFAALLSLLLSTLATGVTQGAPPVPDLVTSLQQQTSDQLRIAYDDITGHVRFIGTAAGRPIQQPASLPVDATPEQAARHFLSNYGSLLGLGDQARDLRPLRSLQADRGRSVVRFQQLSGGVPVLGGEIVVQLDADKNILSVNGETLPGPVAEVVPAVDAGSARQIALAAMEKSYPGAALEADAPELWVYNPALLGARGPALTSLVWRTEVRATDLSPIRELVLVDARLGSVVLHFNQISTALNRVVYDHNNTSGLPLPGSSPARSEGQGATGVADVDTAYDYAGDVYSYYMTMHGRDSLNGAGMTLISTVRYCENGFPCPYANAFWNGQQMVYGEGYAVDDVVGHEMTHAVTDFESSLFYYMQSGAINEAFSDLWGELIDQGNGRGDDAAGVKWLLGEDLPIGEIRSMSDPAAAPFGQPDRMTSSNYECDANEQDRGGVHTNSGVANKAFFLMTDGGSFNGKTVTGIGSTKVAKIVYEVQRNLMTSAGDYKDLYNLLQQACTNLTGSSGITAADCQQVKNAVDAVEMTLQPAACPANEAPAALCLPGQSAVDLFTDNMENTTSGNWTKGAVSGPVSWYYPQNTHGYDFDATYATSGQYNLWGYDQPAGGSSYIQMASPLSLPAGSTVYMRFNHAFGFEDGAGAYDGGIVEYSVNGTTWTNAGSLFQDNGYNGSLTSGTGNPLAGQQAFVRESNGYISSRLNLSPLAGQNVRLRFRIGTDSSIDDLGWFIDDVRIYSCTGQALMSPRVRLPMLLRNWPPLPATPVLNTIANPDGDGNYTVSWGAAELATSYTLQEANNPDFTGASNIYTGAATSTNVSGKPNGTYYYRVRANNSWGSSTWSATQAAAVGAPSGIVNGGFEAGTSGWTGYSSHGWPIIINSGFPGTVRPRSGAWLAWLGGDLDDVSYIQQQVVVPPGNSYLAYWHWIASGDECGYDFGGVLVNNTVVDVYTLCQSTNTGGWARHVVNLGAYSAQLVTFQIRAETDGSVNSNLFVDDVTFQASAAAAMQGEPPAYDPQALMSKLEQGVAHSSSSTAAEAQWLLRPPDFKPKQ